MDIGRVQMDTEQVMGLVNNAFEKDRQRRLAFHRAVQAVEPCPSCGKKLQYFGHITADECLLMCDHQLTELKLLLGKTDQPTLSGIPLDGIRIKVR